DESADMYESYRNYCNYLQEVIANTDLSQEARDHARMLYNNKKQQVLKDVTNRSGEKRSIVADAPEATVLYKKKKTNSLDQALSYVPPPAIYPSDASISETVTSISGIWPPTRLRRWSEFLNNVTSFAFDEEPNKHEKPKFTKGLKIRVEPDVDAITSVNIYHNLNTLMGPRYEFSKQKNSDFKSGDPNIGKGIPDSTCRVFRNDDGNIIIPIEIKRNLVVESLINDEELALENTHTRDAVKQIYNYMISLHLQYGVLSSYDYHWFLCRPKANPTELLISEALPLESTSPTVLKSYAYLAYLAARDPTSPHPNTIPDRTRSVRQAI
ncbi:17495_t:CDS:2, partial [Racocetra fulgida]